MIYSIYDYDKSIKDFFDGIRSETPDDSFLVISVKDRKLENFER